jgi:L-ascorbate metabolism protein UlaG (beta-lactamase superfamily)
LRFDTLLLTPFFLEEAVKIAKDVQAKNLLAMHWGTIQLSDEPPFEAPIRFQQAAERAGFSPDEIWIFKIGETRLLKNCSDGLALKR